MLMGHKINLLPWEELLSICIVILSRTDVSYKARPT